MKIAPLNSNTLPKAPKLRNILGPSFIVLGLGLGSGEVILWPYLASQYGLGIIWGALIGITFQFIMNMEIQRYALVRGESIFVGFARKLGVLPYWFIFSTFIPWMWPGLASASASIFGHVFDLDQAYTKYISIGILIAIGIILSAGSIIYKTVEKFQKVLISIGVPSIFILSIVLSTSSDWSAAIKGVVGIGDGYVFLPESIAISSFLAALAYAGVGGNLNLANSFYIKEKGFGMGKYAHRIKSLAAKKSYNGNASLIGSKFDINSKNISTFKKWWKVTNLEHLIVFWFTGAATIILLSVMAYSTVYGDRLPSDISFLFVESAAIGTRIAPIAGTFFLLVTASILIGTQLTIYDSTSRVLTENSLLIANKGRSANKSSIIYFSVLWISIIAGIIIFMSGFNQPLQLIFISAILNAIAMFVHIGLTLWLNKSALPKAIGPSRLRTYAMSAAFIFYGGFSIYVVVTELTKIIS